MSIAQKWTEDMVMAAYDCWHERKDHCDAADAEFYFEAGAKWAAASGEPREQQVSDAMVEAAFKYQQQWGCSYSRPHLQGLLEAALQASSKRSV